MFELFSVHARAGITMVVLGRLKVAVGGEVELPVVLLEAVDGGLLTGVGEGDELLYLVPLR